MEGEGYKEQAKRLAKIYAEDLFRRLYGTPMTQESIVENFSKCFEDGYNRGYVDAGIFILKKEMSKGDA